MAHKLNITLRDPNPKIKRIVVVPENFSFYNLHLVIQDVMNWDGAHLFQFNLGAPYNSTAIVSEEDEDEDEEWFGRKTLMAEKELLSNYFNGQYKKVNYVYDFGDDWIHTVTVLKKPTTEVDIPICLKAENVAPIEDCGGLWGFEELLEISAKSNRTKEEKAQLEWYGIGKDEKYEDVYGVDIAELNERLRADFDSKIKKRIDINH